MKTIFLSLLLFISVNAQELLTLFADDAIEYTINANAQTYFDSLDTPLTDSVQIHLSKFCDALDDSLNAGARNKTLAQLGFDRIWLLANETAEASNKDLVHGADLAPVNSPTLTQWLGYKGTGTQYLNSQFDASTEGVNYTLNSMSAGVYVQGTAETAGALFGLRNVSDRIMLYANTTTTGFIAYINSQTTYAITFPDTLGVYALTRVASDTSRSYLNGTLVSTSTVASVAIPAGDIFIGARNRVGTGAEIISQRRYSAAFFGKGFTAVEIRKISNCIETFWMDKIGTGVLP